MALGKNERGCCAGKSLFTYLKLLFCSFLASALASERFPVLEFLVTVPSPLDAPLAEIGVGVRGSEASRVRAIVQPIPEEDPVIMAIL